ncbi:MAG: FkbM family methyltransferase [Bosea sp. (in: a-proteobacteria)]
MTSSTDELATEVRELYARLHANELRAADTISFDLINPVDYSQFIKIYYESRDEFEARFGNFARSYAIFRVFTENQIVLDIGADWGYSAVAMMHEGCKANIISVEASPANATTLNSLNKFTNGRYSWINTAVTAEEMPLTFYIPVMNGSLMTGLSSTGSTLDDYFAEHLAKMAVSYPPAEPGGKNVVKLAIIKVTGKRLDTILQENGGLAAKVVAVKMDVEGHEAEALQGAKLLFTTQKPLLMLEEANRNPKSTAVMMGYGYFHCERTDGVLSAHTAYSFANDGYWIHPDQVENYRKLGIFTGSVPSAAEIATPPKDDGVLRKGSAGQG